jgi:cobalt/nickel transport system permease protein
MGVMAAFIFAAQMINFPVAGGTSGHLIGGALAAIALGPWAAMLVMAAVVGVQALLFQDGGLLALGANVLNMGVVPAAIGYGLYRGAAGAARPVRLAVAGTAAWLSVVGAALLTALQLWLSGASSLTLVVPAMLGVHALIGVGEALITVAALSFVLRTRPDLVEGAALSGGRGWVPAGLVASLAVVLLAPFASADPDGLERVAQDLGFLERAQEAPHQLLPDYTIPGIDDPTIATAAAGLVGVAIVVGVVAALARLARRASAPSAP